MVDKLKLEQKFELSTKQAIQNYKESLNDILDAIRNIRKEVGAIKDDLLRKIAFLNSKQNGLIIDVTSFKEELKQIKALASKDFNDQSAINSKILCRIEDVSSQISKCVSSALEASKDIQCINSQILEKEDKFKKSILSINNNVDTFLVKFREQSVLLKNELKESPKEILSVKKELEDKISSHAVDVAGIMRELNIYKKENHITQKKIENLYTLFDRLKNREVIQ